MGSLKACLGGEQGQDLIELQAANGLYRTRFSGDFRGRRQERQDCLGCRQQPIEIRTLPI